MVIPVAVLDACALYSAPLRDLFMELASADLIRARWTGMIHDEWIRNVLADRLDLKRSQLERTRALMDAIARDALVTGFEPLIPGLSLPDADDRHVLAAAISCDAGVIVTFNLKDFPGVILAPHGIKAQHPDEFLGELIDQDLRGVCEAAKVVRGRLNRPPIAAEVYLDGLDRHGLIQSVARLRACVDLI